MREAPPIAVAMVAAIVLHLGCGREQDPASQNAPPRQQPARAERPPGPKEPATVPAYEKWEVRVPVELAQPNPFAADRLLVVGVFTHTSGDEHRVPGFWFRDYDYEPVDDPRSERFTPAGEPEFRVRFAPPVPGGYTYHFLVTANGETGRIPGGRFQATPARGPGPLKRKPSSRYLVNSAGQPVFLIGQNVGWSKSKAPLADLLRYIDEMADTGQNFLRLWHCTWGMGYEHEEMGRYDLARAWQLDRLIERAEKRGVYIMFCFENFHDVKTKKSPYWLREDGQEGAIETREEYFTSPRARQAFRNRLHYAIARWGYSNAIAAWEFFNEMEYAVLGPLELNSSVRDRYFRPWLTEMAAHVREWDAHRHLLSNSLAVDRVWDGMNRMEWLDIVQHHVYLNAWDTDGAEKVLRSLSYVSDYGKPYLLGEFGGAEAGVYGQTVNTVNQTDTLGIHLHNAIWSSALSGSCCTALMWWWDGYVRPNKLYHHYAALSAFLQGTPWLDPRLRAEDLSTRDARVLTLRGASWALVWAQNLRYTWENARTIKNTEAVAPFQVRLKDMKAGSYEIEWWDTLKGAAVRTRELTGDGTITVDVPRLKTDVAVKVRRLDREK